MDKDALLLLAIVIGVAIFTVGYFIHRGKLDMLNEPAVWYAKALAEHVALNKEKRCKLEIYCQNGRLYHKPVEYENANEALKAMQKTLNRAKIKTIRISENSDTVLEAQRALKSVYGKANRKVGGFKISTC